MNKVLFIHTFRAWQKIPVYTHSKCEKIFATSGEVSYKKRSQLIRKTAEKLIFVNKHIYIDVVNFSLA